MAYASLVDWLRYAGARDSTGEPVSSGFAYFYVPGSTSTAVTVYADPACATPLSQPVALDAGGRAEVYCPVQSEVIIKDAFGATVSLSANATSVCDSEVIATWHGDPFTQKDINKAIEDSIGSSGLYSESATTGVLARTVHDMLHQSISPYDFSAAGNGTYDDTVALQRAIDRAIAANVPLHLEAGTYKITAGLVVNAPLNISGAGMGLSKIIATSEAFDGITVTVPSGSIGTGFEFRDFAVLLPYATGAGYTAIKIAAGSNSTMSRLNVTATVGIDTSSGTNISCNSCTVATNGSAGHIARGIVLGEQCSANECKINCNPLAGTVQYSYGVLFAAPGSTAKNCSVLSASDGYFFVASANAKQLAILCKAYICTRSFRFNGGSTGAIGCDSILPVTADFVDAASPTTCVDVGNSWATVQVDTIGIKTVATTSPSFEFDPSKDINVFRATYAGAVGTLTITWPSPAPALAVGTKYRIVIQTTGSTTSASATSINSHITTLSPPTTLAANTYYTAEFIVANATDGGITQLSPSWTVVANPLWY